MTPLPGPADRRRLGTSELTVGPIAYGCWRMAEGDRSSALSNVSTALDAGFDLIDTADIYGFDGHVGFGDAETLLGEVLATTPGLRDRMVLATKGAIRPGVPYDWSAEYLVSACESSMRRLQVETVDLYQLHRPDVLTHPDEVATALNALVDRGLVRAVGLSNVTPSQFQMLQSRLDRPLVTTQPEFSIWHTEPVRDGTFDHCLTHSVTPLAWSPLGGGRVANDVAGALDEVLDRIAERHGVDRSAIALAFVMAHPAGAIPIMGTQRVERIEAARVALDVRLERTEWYDLYQAATGERLP